MKKMNYLFRSLQLISMAAILYGVSTTSASEIETAALQMPSKEKLNLATQIEKAQKKESAVVQTPEQKQADKEAGQKMLKDSRYKSLFNEQLKKNNQYMKENGAWGGGNTIRRSANERPILLDFFTAQPNFVDTAFTNAPLVDTDKMKFMATQAIEVQDLPAYTSAREILLKWQPQNKGLIDALLIALENLQIKYIWRGVPLADAETYYLPEELTRVYHGGSLTPVVVYSATAGLLMSGPEWNLLGDLSQAGLLVHESLRRIQLSYSLTVSPQKLQALTAAIMLQNPSSGLDLETTQFLDQKLLDEINRVSSKKLAPTYLKQAVCSMTELKLQPSPFGMICQTPDCSVQIFCSAIKKYDQNDLVGEIKEMNQQVCLKKVKSPSVDLSIKLAFTSNIQLEEKNNANMNEIYSNPRASNMYIYSVERSDYVMNTAFLTLDLPQIILTAYKPNQVTKFWTTWKTNHCNNDAPLNQKDVIDAAKFIYATEDKKLQTLALNNYVTLSNNSPVYSKVALYEKLRQQALQEQELNKRYNRDVLGEELIDNHLLGKVKHPQFLSIVRGYRAMEEFIRQNAKIEKVDF